MKTIVVIIGGGSLFDLLASLTEQECDCPNCTAQREEAKAASSDGEKKSKEEEPIN